MMQPRRDLPLRPLTTFGVAGTAAVAWTLDRLDQIDPLLEKLARGCDAALPFVLGGGSNVLFVRDLHEPLILVRLRGRRLLADDGTQVLLEVGAGEVWDEIVSHTLAQGWFGLENLSLIPGLAGGAPWQNIGAYGVEVAGAIEAVDAVNLRSGSRRRFGAADCTFGYRSSFFKTGPGRHWLITAVRLRLSRQPQPHIGYGEIRAELAAQAAAGTPAAESEPTPQQVAQAVRAIRRRKLPDPQVAGEPQLVKLSAGWLIETAGWKGFRDGDAGVSAQHALVLVNHGTASGRQLLALAQRIAQSVQERFGVALEPEPVIVA